MLNIPEDKLNVFMKEIIARLWFSRKMSQVGIISWVMELWLYGQKWFLKNQNGFMWSHVTAKNTVKMLLQVQVQDQVLTHLNKISWIMWLEDSKLHIHPVLVWLKWARTCKIMMEISGMSCVFKVTTPFTPLWTTSAEVIMYQINMKISEISISCTLLNQQNERT